MASYQYGRQMTAVVQMRDQRVVCAVGDCSSVLGLSSLQAEGKYFSELFGSDQSETACRFIRGLRQCRQPQQCRIQTRREPGIAGLLLLRGEAFVVHREPHSLVTVCDLPMQTTHENAADSRHEKWDITFNNISDAITVHDLDHNVMFANDAATELLRCSISDIIGQKCFKLYHGLNGTCENCPFDEVVKTGRRRIRESYEPHLRRYLDLEAMPYHDVKGKPRGVIHVVRDMTRRKKQEERLRFLSSILQQSRDGIAAVNLDGRVVFVNHAFAAMHGYRKHELIGKPLSVFHTADQMEAVNRANRTLSDTGSFVGEIWHVRRDGNCFPTLMTNSMYEDARGRPVAMIATAQDISLLKRREHELRPGPRRYQALLENSAEIVTYFDSEGTLLALNENAAGRLCGKPDDFVGKHVSEIFDTDTANAIIRRIHHVIRTGRMEEHEDQIATGSRKAWFRSKHYPLTDAAAKGTCVQIITSDITDEKNAEISVMKYQHQLEEIVESRMAELNEINRQLTHEIARRKSLENETLRISEEEHKRIAQELHDGPAQQLTGIAFLLKSIQIKQTLKEPLDPTLLDETVQIVRNIIDQVRSLCRGLSPSELEIGNLIAALEELSQTTSHLYDVSCVFEAEQPVIIDDRRVSVHIYRIAREAVINAIKHARARNIGIALKCGENEFVLTIKNDGLPFPDDALCPNSKGMGLRIMKRRAKVIGASVAIRKGPRQGGILTCRIPKKQK